MYDLIGDIHGECTILEALLKKLGYRQHHGTWGHPERKVIFLGDFIDRSPQQAEVLALVRPMVEEGRALAVMGNHEFNALAYYTEDGKGGHLRPHSDKNRKQHLAFLQAFEERPQAWRSTIEWFHTLPLWLELESLRVVHACWDPVWIARLEQEYQGNRLGVPLLHAASDPARWEFEAVETLLKGKEIRLPANHPGFRDKENNLRYQIRTRWWDAQAASYRAAYLGPPDAASAIPDEPIQGDQLTAYGPQQKPVFVGHYWLTGTPNPLAPNIACVDYSVIKPEGKLVAYRWDGERQLESERFVWVSK
jgi:hypothetical protein